MEQTDKDSKPETRNPMEGVGSEFQAPRKGSQTVFEIPPGWHKPKPEKLPKPGYWPALMALGIVFFLWGFAVEFNEVFSSSLVISGVGFILFVIALAGWIGDLRDEREHENE